MGLERAAAVLQDKANVYETDLFSPIIDSVCGLAGKAYGDDPEADYAMRVVAEHARAAVFLIGDGVAPGNEGRGYVLRRVIRRAIRYGRRLGLDQPYLAEVAETVLPRFRQTYPELRENHDFILRVIRLEEERFANSFDRGNAILAGMISYRARHGGAVPRLVESLRRENPGAENAAPVLERYGFSGYHPESSPAESIGHEIAAEQVSQARCRPSSGPWKRVSSPRQPRIQALESRLGLPGRLGQGLFPPGRGFSSTTPMDFRRS